jgi:hypothetical protein
MDENLKPLATREHQQAYGFDRQDRDLLIRLNTRVEDLITSLEKKDNILAQDIGGLKAGKLDKDIYTAHCKEDEKELENTKRVQDEHSVDIKNLNKYLWIGMGALAVIQFLMPFVINKYFK